MTLSAKEAFLEKLSDMKKNDRSESQPTTPPKSLQQDFDELKTKETALKEKLEAMEKELAQDTAKLKALKSCKEACGILEKRSAEETKKIGIPVEHINAAFRHDVPNIIRAPEK